MLLVKLSLVLAGLTAPGLLLAMALRVERPWLAAFPVSALIMVEMVQLFALTGVPISMGAMALTLIGWTLALFSWLQWHPPAAAGLPESGGETPLPAYPRWAVLGFGVSLVLIVGVRTALFPLRGTDTGFRWEGLALAMLQHRSLDFYPPVTAGDFSIYLYADGIPPLVATVYWWLYAVIGTPFPPATALSIGLQLAMILALTYFATDYAYGRQAAWFALLVAGASPLLVSGVAIGQETGFTALAVAGQLCFAWLAVRRPCRSAVIMAALFAALGALSRDYGPALAVTGGSILWWHRETRRLLPLFLSVAMLLAVPWYLRNWALTGNPFYSHRLPGGFAVNPIHADIFDYYREVYALAGMSVDGWLQLFRHLVAGTGLALMCGVAGVLAYWRKAGPLLMGLLTVLLLWLASVGHTAGGAVYSTRVLTPAVVILAILAGAGLSQFFAGEGNSHRPVVMRAAAGMMILLLCGYSLASMANYPARTPYLFSVPTGTISGSAQQRVVDTLEKTELPATGVLTEATFLADAMKRNSRFRPVMHWNPEVEFVFDPRLDPTEIRRKLWEKDIRLLLVDYKSVHNRLLSRYAFFRESEPWQLVFKIPNEFAVYALR